MPTLADILDLANLLLSSAVAVVAFSLLAYVLAYNVRNRVGRAFAALLTFVLIVYTGDVILYLVAPEQADLWLRLQWLGIPFVTVVPFRGELSTALRNAHGRGGALRGGGWDPDLPGPEILAWHRARSARGQDRVQLRLSLIHI